MPDDIKLPEPAFRLFWHERSNLYSVSKPNIGDTDVYTADQLRAAVLADRAGRWQPIETAPQNTGDLVLVYWIDECGGERYELDNTEDGCWMQWNDHADHMTIIGAPRVNYTPPYTHWMRITPPEQEPKHA